MSEQPPRDDEPTRAYTPFGEDAGEPTRMDTPVPPYDSNPPLEPPVNPYAPGQREPEPDKEKREWLAPVVTVGLIAILLGVGLGWLLFRNSSPSSDEPATTTTVMSTTTSTSGLPAVVATTTTTGGNTTTTAGNTTTTSATRSSSTVRATTTTARPAASSTSTAPTTTNPGNIVVTTEP